MPRLLFSLILLLLAGARALPAASALSAGAARADITPPPEMLNWVGVPRPYGAIHDPIFARALVLSDGEARVALIVWDLLDAREYAVARVRSAVAAATGIAAEHILIGATHNHSGPKSEMGPERVTAREARTSRPAQQDPLYRQWADRLVEICQDLVRRADAAKRPATLSLGRAYVGEWLFNRRPLRPDGTVESSANPANPFALPGGLRFGAVDPTLTVLSLQEADETPIATLLHAPIHAVSIYPSYSGISADWPGPTLNRVQAALGGEALFLQGCAGDIVPSRRGFEAVEAMSQLISDRAIAAQRVASSLAAGKLRVSRAVLGLPVTASARHDLQRETLDAEVQVITSGPLALVTLPGEPLLELATAIQARSPFPHTLVLGYTNGRGVGYVGLPGGKARGGYEMGEVGHGADEAGLFLVETSVRLLREHRAASGQ